ncbi:hypothetical protein ACWGB8_16100 [Kitasatospora sp. NPDC054939]
MAGLYGLMAAVLGAVAVWSLPSGEPHATLVAVLAGVCGAMSLFVALAFCTRPGGPVASLAVAVNMALSLVWLLAVQGLLGVGLVLSIVRGESVLGSGRRTGIVVAVVIVAAPLYAQAVKRLNLAIDHW